MTGAPMTNSAQLRGYLAGVHPGMRPFLEQMNDAALERICALVLLPNGDRLRELAGTDAADAVLAVAAEALHAPSRLPK